MKKRSKGKTDWKRLDAMPDRDIDKSDIPELDAEFFKNAELKAPEKQNEALEYSKGKRWME